MGDGALCTTRERHRMQAACHTTRWRQRLYNKRMRLEIWSCISCGEGVEALELENETKSERVMFDVLISRITALKTYDVKCGDNTLNATSEKNNASGAYMEWIFSLNIKKKTYILQ